MIRPLELYLHHLQEAFCVSTPPSIGPSTVAIMENAYTSATIPASTTTD